jgi:hypothetical protein
MRKRYLPRSLPDMRDQTVSYERRAAATARSTSEASACAIRAMTSSVAGEIVSNTSPEPSTNSPSMKSPYWARRFRIAVDSGAGAYSRKLMGQSTVT